MRRWVILAAALLLGVPLLAFGAFLLLFDADALRPRLVAELERATGRRVAVERLQAAPALVPTIVAEGVRLSNIEGGSAPDMLRARRAEVTLALLPLLSGRVELKRIAVEDADLLLERENWRFVRPDAGGAAPPSGRGGAVPRLGALSLRDARLTALGETMRLLRADLTAAAEGGMDLSAALIARGAEALLEGHIPLGDGPLRLAATLPGARVTAQGARRGADVTAEVSAEARDLSALSSLAGAPLPALSGVALRARVAWAGGALALSDLDAHATGGEVAGVAFAGLRIVAPAMGEASRIEASGQWRGQPFRLQGEGPPPAAMLGAAALPVALKATLGSAEATLRGPLPLPGRPVPQPLAVTLRAPDAAALGLPALREVQAEAGVAWDGTRLGLSALRADASAGDIGGDVTLAFAPRLAVAGTIASQRLDLDALRGPAAPPAAAPARRDRLIPDTPLDLSALAGFDADLSFSAASLTLGGTALRDVSGRLVARGGQALLDPLALTHPGGRLSLRAAADAEARTVQLAGGGRGLDLAALVPALEIGGRADLDMDLRGQGGNLRAVAATLTGHLGLAVTEGRIAARLARGMFSGVPGMPGGAVPLSCLAVRAQADRGLVRFPTLFADGSVGRASGEGSLNLRDETLALRFAVDLRLAVLRLRAPVPLTGTLLNPRLDWGGVAQGALGDVAQNALSLPGQIGRLVPGIGSAVPQIGALPDCGPALAAARGGRAAPAPQPILPRATQPAEQLLRGLLGR
jgi:AsmA protein